MLADLAPVGVNTPSDFWLAQALSLPVSFAMMREDPLLELHLLDRLQQNARIVSIASGGCTAALLATSERVANLILVDCNPAQLNLARLKLYLLVNRQPVDRLKLLGHKKMQPKMRLEQLLDVCDKSAISFEALGRPETIAGLGLDFSGKFECLFAALASKLQPLAPQILAIINNGTAIQRAQSFAPGSQMGNALEEAFQKIMTLPNLVALFGEAATSNRQCPFADHFVKRTRLAIASADAACNPYLSLVLTGRLSANSTLPWLSVSPCKIAHVDYVQSSMSDALAAIDKKVDLINLSNILDWLTPQQAAYTLDLAWKALKPGGYLLIRQLNSSLFIPELCPDFIWLKEADNMHALDRSFFYQKLHLGLKQ